jgi:hypothetical protein
MKELQPRRWALFRGWTPAGPQDGQKPNLLMLMVGTWRGRFTSPGSRLLLEVGTRALGDATEDLVHAEAQ